MVLLLPVRERSLECFERHRLRVRLLLAETRNVANVFVVYVEGYV